MATIQEVYIALFGRPADPVGYQFYVEATDDGANLDAVGSLANSPEYLERFEGQSEIDSINQIYQDLFGRPADAEGLLFYVQLLQSGEASIQDIAIRILDGATGTDAAIIDNKVEAAQLFTDSLDTAEEITAYQGEQAAEAGRNYLTGVTGDDSTVPTQEEVDAAVAEIVADAPDGPVGDSFTLTAAAGEQIDGTSGSDTINAIVGADQTINNFDDIQGGAGIDTMNIIVDGAFDIPASASINGVENINLDIEAGALGTVDAEDFEGAVTFRQAGAAALAVEGLLSAQTVEFTDDVASIGYLDGEVSATVSLDEVNSGEVLNVDGIDLTSLTINGSVEDVGGAAGTLNVTTTEEDTAVAGNDGSNIETVTLNLTSDTVVVLTDLLLSEDFDVLDASGSTGGIEFSTNFVGPNFLSTVTTGSGADVVYFDGDFINDGEGGEDVTIDVGAGDDEVSYAAYGNTDAAAVSITLGEGNDLLSMVESFDNVVDASEANFEASLVTVEDFNGDEDVLDISGLGLTFGTVSNIEASGISAAASLFAAVELAAATIDGGADAVVFQYGADTYILGSGDATFDDFDGLVKLTGVSVADLDASSFIS